MSKTKEQFDIFHNLLLYFLGSIDHRSGKLSHHGSGLHLSETPLWPQDSPSFGDGRKQTDLYLQLLYLQIQRWGPHKLNVTDINTLVYSVVCQNMFVVPVRQEVDDSLKYRRSVFKEKKKPKIKSSYKETIPATDIIYTVLQKQCLYAIWSCIYKILFFFVLPSKTLLRHMIPKQYSVL